MTKPTDLHDFKAKVCGKTLPIFAWWDSLEAREVFHTGRYLSCFRRQLLHKLQSPPEGLVLAQEGLLGWRVGRDRACLDRWNLRNLHQLIDEWVLNCKHKPHVYSQRAWGIFSNRHLQHWCSSMPGLTYFSSRVWGSVPSRQRTAAAVHSRSRACVPGWERTQSGLWCSVWPCSSSWAFQWQLDPLDLKHEVKQEGWRRDESGKNWFICSLFVSLQKDPFIPQRSKTYIQDSSIIYASGQRTLSRCFTCLSHTYMCIINTFLSFICMVFGYKAWNLTFWLSLKCITMWYISYNQVDHMENESTSLIMMHTHN